MKNLSATGRPLKCMGYIRQNKMLLLHMQNTEDWLHNSWSLKACQLFTAEQTCSSPEIINWNYSSSRFCSSSLAETVLALKAILLMYKMSIKLGVIPSNQHCRGAELLKPFLFSSEVVVKARKSVFGYVFPVSTLLKLKSSTVGGGKSWIHVLFASVTAGCSCWQCTPLTLQWIALFSFPSKNNSWSWILQRRG